MVPLLSLLGAMPESGALGWRWLASDPNDGAIDERICHLEVHLRCYQ